MGKRSQFLSEALTPWKTQFFQPYWDSTGLRENKSVSVVIFETLGQQARLLGELFKGLYRPNCSSRGVEKEGSRKESPFPGG